METVVAAEDVQVGDVLRVLPGETVAVDGTVLEGRTSIDESVMTGESLPVDKAPGDEVKSGTVNQFGAFDMRAQRVGEDSSLARMIELVQSADAGKAKIVRLADRWATWIVVIALTAAAGTWLVTGEIIRAVTILVVFCPCALVLATPTAIMAAIGNVTKLGVLVREGDALERLAKVRKVAFDKTGTLTYGRPEVVAVGTIEGSKVDEEQLYSLVASAESMSEHPLGKAVVRGWEQRAAAAPGEAATAEASAAADAASAAPALARPSSFDMVPGRGVRASVAGRDVAAGNREMLAELGVDSPARIPFKSLGLSLSDQYWIRPENCEIAWEDVNYFDNDFCEMRSGRGWLDGVGLDSPDNTSEGELPKKWVCDGAKRLLVKGGSVLNQEPFNEAAASALYSRLLAPDEYVKYRLESRAGGAVCICENFVGSTEEYIPAYYVRQTMRQPNHRNDYQHYLECCSALDAERVEIALSKMIVCDDILGNSDRHWRNFGLVRDVETLRYRIAPLFDTGGSLWCSSTLESLRAHDFSFTTKPFYEDANRQLRLVNDYSWFDPAALEGFADELSAILSDNPALVERVDYICCAVQKRIDRIVRML